MVSSNGLLRWASPSSGELGWVAGNETRAKTAHHHRIVAAAPAARGGGGVACTITTCWFFVAL